MTPTPYDRAMTPHAGAVRCGYCETPLYNLTHIRLVTQNRRKFAACVDIDACRIRRDARERQRRGLSP